jgi:hypothetical protein
MGRVRGGAKKPKSELAVRIAHWRMLCDKCGTSFAVANKKPGRSDCKK